MSRFAALFAIIAFVVMSTGMASARPMISNAVMTKGVMANTVKTMDHGAGAPKAPCSDGASMTCDLCCAIAPTPSLALRTDEAIRRAFPVTALAAQTGLAVPPALPPPRAAAAMI